MRIKEQETRLTLHEHDDDDDDDDDENCNSETRIHFDTVFVRCLKSEYNLVTVDSCMPDESRLQSHVATLFNSTRELEYKSAYSPDKIHLTQKIKHDSLLLYSTFRSALQQLACMIRTRCHGSKSHSRVPLLHIHIVTSSNTDGFGGVVVSMLASSTQVRGFKPGRSRWIFTGVKILSIPSSGGEVKESVPCPSFAACKRT